MAPLKIRFVWNTPEVPGGRWHGGLLNLKRIPKGKSHRQVNLARPDDPQWHEYRRHRLHLSLRGLLVWSAATAFTVYLGGAAFVQHRLETASPHLRLDYLDLALPSRWPILDQKRGAALIAEGRDLIAAERFNEGFILLRAGLARHPADPAARLEVARIYTALRLQPQAVKILREGLVHGYPDRSYLTFTLELLTDAKADATRLEVCRLALDQLARLPADSRPPGDEDWLAQQTVQVLFALGRPAEAIAFVESSFPAHSPFRREIVLLHHLESGRPAEAADLARLWIADEPANPTPLRLLIRIDRETGDFAALDADLARLRSRSPDQAEPFLVAISENHRARRPEAAQASLDALLLRHGADLALYEQLAPLLATLDFPAGLDRIEKELRERGLSSRPVLWARHELACSAHDWTAVLACSARLAASPGPDLSPAQAAWLETSRLLAEACLDPGSGTQTSLVESVAARPGGLRLYAVLLTALLDAGRPATARQILTLSEGPYPDAPAIVALRSRIETDLAAAAPAPAASESSPPAFLSHEAFEEAFASRIQDKDTSGALGLLASVRRARPDWLADAEAALDALELPLLARSDASLRLRLLARSVLARDPAGPASLLALARLVHAEGFRENALVLVREILRQDPPHPEALAQQKQWDPDAPQSATLAAAGA